MGLRGSFSSIRWRNDESPQEYPAEFPQESLAEKKWPNLPKSFIFGVGFRISPAESPTENLAEVPQNCRPECRYRHCGTGGDEAGLPYSGYEWHKKPIKTILLYCGQKAVKWGIYRLMYGNIATANFSPAENPAEIPAEIPVEYPQDSLT
jgi:hypothetical protein